MEAVKGMEYRDWRTKVIDITFPRSQGPAGLEAALDRICAEASLAIEDGFKMLVLSDRGEGGRGCVRGKGWVWGCVRESVLGSW